MGDDTSTTLAILGRQPELGAAELEGLYGPANLKKLGEGVVELAVEPAAINFERLGGVVKLARLLSKLDDHDWPNLEKYLVEELPRQLLHAPKGKFTLGLSVYGMSVSPSALQKTLMKIKSAIREGGRPVRIVPNYTSALNSAQVIHNQLTSPRGWELIVVRHERQILIGQTLRVQDIGAYGRRDQARPKRDAKVGMLPPKLAQIVINLANPPIGSMIIDPFCGTGVILQEALLMGYDTSGTDIDQRLVDYSIENLEWLRAMRPEIANSSQVEQGDATSHTWPSPIGVVASETYLGRPLNILPPSGELSKIIADVNTILSKFLRNLSPQLELGTRLCLAIPAWRDGQKFIKLPLVAKITDMGYNLHQFQHVDTAKLIYHRAGQIVGRQLLTLEKI